MEELDPSEAAKLLGVEVENLEVLEHQGLIHSILDATGQKRYSAQSISRIKSRRGPTVADAATQVGIGIQREMATSITSTRKVLILAGGALFGYIFLVGVFTASFIASPLNTAKWLGIAKPTNIASSRVLGVETSIEPEDNSSILTFFQPIGKVSLGLVKNLSPSAYNEISEVVILEAEDVLELDTTGAITPERPISLPESSFLQVGSSELIANLNSDFLQGKQPGTSPGDIALVSEPVILTPTPQPLVLPRPIASGLTNSNLSGSAGITNANLANSSLKVDTSGPLSGGGSVTLGGALTISCPTCATSASSTTSSIDTATNFTGSLTGDVTGTQGATVIAGLTTSNFSSTNISQWTNNLGFITNSSLDTLTSKIISGATNSLSDIENTSLVNSGLTFAANLGSGDTSLGGMLTISGGGINTSFYAGQTLTITGTEADTLATVTGRGATASMINVGTLNGLILLADPVGFSLTGGMDTKSLTVRNDLVLVGTDGTFITFQGSDTYVGRSTFDTLVNKTISASSNTITGLTNTNLSGSAGITNANLANSSFTTNGNSGSGSVSLGGALTFTGSGVNITASGSTLTFASTEADTLQSVIARGHTISTTTGITPNTIDAATIAIGNIASTDQQNFATLNITNGGSGFLDVELVRGFINYQGMNTLYDDFTSRTLDTANRWNTTLSGTGSSCSILGGGLNGLLRFDSGPGINRGCELTTQAITTLADGYYQRGNNPIFETKLKIDIVTNARIFAGFTEEQVPTTSDTNPNTNHAYIAKRSTDTTWQCITDDGGASETVTDTGVTILPNTFYRLRVELRSGTVPETICTVDNGTIVTRIVVTATQPGATSSMDVYVKLNQSDAIAKNMDVDYVRAWQDDPPVLVVNTEANLTSESVTDAGNVLGEENVGSDSESFGAEVGSVFNNIFKSLVEFFGRVIFHSDVAFLGRPSFNKDTAGFVFIEAGQSEVSLNFDREYAKTPVVNISVNLIGEIKANEIPEFAVYDVSTKGFKIKLSHPAASNLNFSWIALMTNGDNLYTSPSSNSSLPANGPTPIPSLSPELPTSSQPVVDEATASITPTPTPESVLLLEGSSSAELTL